ncbi:MAG: hypothetical protein H6733_03265 [Alphaproteobacteria bacterium]|nr:hypothetical protein [Alphaproteobacteria bacterium]
MSDDLPGLDHYALRSMDYGQLTGLSIACHAIPDSFLLMHVGVGCKNKATAHLLVHDWKEHANIREGWTEVGDRDLILGASERAGPYLRSWFKRMEPAVMVVTSVTFLDLAGEDLPDKVAAAAADLPCPVVYVKAPGYDPDLYVGYAKLIAEVVRAQDWKAPPVDPKRVTVTGYLFDRYEGDHEGNLAQIRGLLKALGLELGVTLLSGRPWAELLTAHEAGVVVELPYARPVSKKLARSLKGRTVVRTDLPMGLKGTSRWLRDVGAATGADAAKVARFTEGREAWVLRSLDTMLDRWRSQAVAVIAEAPLAAGLCAMLLELGLDPVLVGVRGTSLGGADAVRDVLAADGLALPDDAEVIEDPSLASLRDRFAALLQAGRLDGVFGSATDLNVLTTLPPESFAADRVDGRFEPQGPFLVEIGFPCRDHHALMPMPYLGYGGVVVMAQRIVDARRIWDAGRRPTFQL